MGTLIMEWDSIEKQFFLLPSIGFGQNVIIFGVNMSSSVHIDNKKRHFNAWKRTKTRIRTYFNCRKNVLD